MNKHAQKIKRQIRIRKKIKGTAKMPRLTVFRSNKGIYAQLIDDIARKTLLGVSYKEIEKMSGKDTTKTKQALELGKYLAKRATAKKITKVVFDKGSYAYHGRIKGVADGAREGGLIF